MTQTVVNIAVVACILSLPVLLAAQGSDDAGTVAAELQQNQNAAAVATADGILANHPSDCRVLTLRGIALSRQHQLPEAEDSFHRALENCPESLPALEGAAQIAYASHSPEASALLQRILLQRPDDQTAHAMLGSLAFQRQDCHAAIAHFERSPALVEKSVEAQRELGSCEFYQGDHRKAVETFRRIAQRDPSEKNLSQLAVVQWKSRDGAEALTTLQPLVTSAEAGSKTLALAAQIAEDQGDTPHAVEWLRAAMVKDPGDVNNYLHFAAISFNHASYQVGIDVVNAGIQQSPQSARLYLSRGVLSVQLSHFPEAVADFEKAHTLDPRLSFAQDAMGMVRSQQHDSAGSLAIFEKQAVEHPQDALLQYLYAEALSQVDGSRQDSGTAIAAARKSLELEPDYQPARDLLCTLLLKANQYSQVIDQAGIALQHDPNDQSALYQEIQAQRRLGNKEALPALVGRLDELKRQQQVSQAQYLLEDANSSRSAQ
jgi:tetratricopeptide (TPR) repeat protein